MLSTLFNRQPPLDEESVKWIIASYQWTQGNFASRGYFNQARLVLPNNEFFPGRSNSVQEMARLVFGKVAEYAGMDHWSWQLIDAYQCELDGPLQLPKAVFDAPVGAKKLEMMPLPVVYRPEQVSNPETLIAGFAHTLAQYLGATARQAPPGGVQNWPQITELMAIFMGFGLMFANSALIFPPGGCRSCGVQNQQRENALSQWDCTYALALFCTLKSIPYARLKPYLKKSLRGYYKRCVRDICARAAQLPGAPGADCT